MVIEDSEGMRIRSLVSETYFQQAGILHGGMVRMISDVILMQPNMDYIVSARFVSPVDIQLEEFGARMLKIFMSFCHTHGDPPWSLPTHGRMAADHSPPGAAVFVPTSHSPQKSLCFWVRM